ncbi:MAG: hypothetical protein Q9183_002027 [Haloplaca sp. 2 TL-2023]
MKPLTSELTQLVPRECPRYATFGAAQGLSTLYLGKGNNKSRQVEQLIEEMMGLLVGAQPKCAAKDIYLHCEDGDHKASKRTTLEERAEPSCDTQYPYKTQCAIIFQPLLPIALTDLCNGIQVNANSQWAATKSSPSLYLKNLPDKLQKDDLRLSLYALFSTYGPVLDVVAMKTKSMRGQAHIVFRDVQASTQAMRALQGFEFFGKTMKIQYGHGKSDTIAKLDGTYRMPSATTNQVTSTELQQSIFNAPPSSVAVGAPSVAPQSKPLNEVADGAANAKEPHGVKRGRDEESDDEGVPMEEDESDAPMEASSDED